MSAASGRWGLSRDANVAITGSDEPDGPRLWETARTGKSLCGPLQTPGPRLLEVTLNGAGTPPPPGPAARTGPRESGRVPGRRAPWAIPLHHPGQVLAVAFRPDGPGGPDRLRRRCRTASGRSRPAEPAGIPVPDGRPQGPLAPSPTRPDGRTILMGHTDGTAQVRDAAKMQPARAALCGNEYANPVGGHQSPTATPAPDRMR